MTRICSFRCILSICCSLSSCGYTAFNSAQVIDNIGKEYEAHVMGAEGAAPQVIQKNGQQYMETQRVRMKENVELRLEDSGFTQLPHRHYIVTETSASPVYHSLTEHPLPFISVQRGEQKLTPVCMKELPNPYGWFTKPLSLLAAVVVDFPVSVVATAADYTLFMPLEYLSKKPLPREPRESGE